MSDQDLIHHLRAAANWKDQKPYQDAELFRKAADYIEALEAKLAGSPRRSPEEKIKGYGEIARDSVGKK